ncbi:hypothetical protein ABZ917_26290 [Nonomuraea wenchangensis]
MGITGRNRAPYPSGAEEALAMVIHRAFLEIRYMVRFRDPLWLEDAATSPKAKEYLHKIHMLSDLGDQLPMCLASMVRRPISHENVSCGLTYTWRTAGPEKRQWLRDAFREVGYDHRHLFPDQGDHDKYDQATMLGKRIRKEFRPAALAALVAQGHDKEAWEEGQWHWVEEIPGPRGPRPHVIFTFSVRSKSRWRKKAALFVAVDAETNHAEVLDLDPTPRSDSLVSPWAHPAG